MLNYETKLKIMDYFNKNMNTPYIFVINKFSKHIDEKRQQSHFTEIIKKIKNNENLMLVSSEHFHQTDKNLILGINEYSIPDIYVSLKNITSNNVSEWTSEFRFEIHKKFFDNFINEWKNDKLNFEEENLIFLHYLSDFSKDNNGYGIPLLNSYVLSMLQSPYVAQEFVKAFKNKQWTEEEFLCLNKSMINPLGLLSSLDTTNYLEFSDAFVKMAKKLKLNGKLLSISKDNNYNRFDRSSLFQNDIYYIGREAINIVTSFNSRGNITLNKFPTEGKEIYYFNDKQNLQKNLEYLLNEPLLKNVLNVKSLIKQAKLYGLIKSERKAKSQNQEDFVDILLDQRNYEYIVFDVKIKETNFLKIMKAFEELSIILSDRTGAKLTLQMHSFSDSRSFVFKVDERCFKNKDDFSIYLKDLLIEMFSLDVKIAHNQIKDYENTVPIINKIIEYTEKNLLKNKELVDYSKNVPIIKEMIEKTEENLAKINLNVHKKIKP
jgi:hypothetical protein